MTVGGAGAAINSQTLRDLKQSVNLLASLPPLFDANSGKYDANPPYFASDPVCFASPLNLADACSV